MDVAEVGRLTELGYEVGHQCDFYVLVAVSQWRNMSNDYSNHNSVYYHYRKWCKDATW